MRVVVLAHTFPVNEAHCDIAIPAGDITALAETVRRMSGILEEKLNRISENGPRFYENNFAKELRINQLERLLMDKLRLTYLVFYDKICCI